MESPSSAANRRRSLRTLRTNTERLAECGHDLMHIDPTSDRDLKCDVCWRNRESLIARLLEPFERALRGVGPSGEIDQAEVERLECEDREREREREEKRKVAEEARRRKEEESKRKRERLRAMQEERRGKGGKFEKKRPKASESGSSWASKRSGGGEKKDVNPSFLQYNGPDGKFAFAEGKSDGVKIESCPGAALGSGWAGDVSPRSTVQRDVQESEGKPLGELEPAARQAEAGGAAAAQATEADGKANKPLGTTSMATDLPSRPDRLQNTSNTTNASGTTPTTTTTAAAALPPAVQSVKAWVFHGNEHFSTLDLPRPPPYRLETRRRRPSSSHSSSPATAQQSLESAIHAIQPPIETRASRRRSASTSEPPSRSGSKSSSRAAAAAKGKMVRSQSRRTSQPSSPGQSKHLGFHEAMMSKSAFAPHDAPSLSSGSESPTIVSCTTAESPSASTSASALAVAPAALDAANNLHQPNELSGSERSGTGGAWAIDSEEASMKLKDLASPLLRPGTFTPRPLATAGRSVPSSQPQHQLTISSFFRLSGHTAATSSSPGSDSSTTNSLNTMAGSGAPTTAPSTAGATAAKQVHREHERKRGLRDRERRRTVREEDNSGRRKSARSVASTVNYCESSDDDDEGQEF